MVWGGAQAVRLVSFVSGDCARGRHARGVRPERVPPAFDT
jgi:hypothetical protein